MPWNDADEATGWQLLRFVAGLTLDLAKIDDLIRDGDDRPGWSNAVDVDSAPAAYLPWIGQMAGVTVDESLSADDQRDQVKQVAGFRRGTVASLVAAAQPYLTGSKAVVVEERDTSAYHFTVATFASETLDAVAVEKALRAEKPAGLVMSYVVRTGLTYDQLAASGKTYDELTAEFPTSDDMKYAQSV